MGYENESTHMNVSYELLMLLQWLLEHEQETMKKIVSKALAHGLQEQIDQHMTQRERQQAAAELQGGIIDFFLMLEASLHRTMNEDHTKEVIQRNLLPALKQMDARTYSIGALETVSPKPRPHSSVSRLLLPRISCAKSF